MSISSTTGNRPATSSTTTPHAPVKLDVTGHSKTEDIGEALRQFNISAEPANAYAKLLEGIQSKATRTSVLKKVEAKVNEFIKSNPNATKEDVSAEARKHLAVQTLMSKHIEKSIMDMAQKSIERMKDSFSEP